MLDRRRAISRGVPQRSEVRQQGQPRSGWLQLQEVAQVDYNGQAAESTGAREVVGLLDLTLLTPALEGAERSML